MARTSVSVRHGTRFLSRKVTLVVTQVFVLRRKIVERVLQPILLLFPFGCGRMVRTSTSD